MSITATYPARFGSTLAVQSIMLQDAIGSVTMQPKDVSAYIARATIDCNPTYIYTLWDRPTERTVKFGGVCHHVLPGRIVSRCSPCIGAVCIGAV